jgi:hypothetical protein
MKQLIVALVLCLSLILPTYAQSENKPLIVFCTSEFANEWTPFSPTVVYTPKTWEDLPDFLDWVKNTYQDQDIVLDFCVHGSGEFLLIHSNSRAYLASMGYFLNQLDKHHLRHATILLEACFSGRVYEQSLHLKNEVHDAGDCFENYHGERPSYPIYGINDYNENIVAFTYLQYHFNEVFPEYFHDLRIYQDKKSPVMDINDNSPDNRVIESYWRILKTKITGEKSDNSPIWLLVSDKVGTDPLQLGLLF